MAELWCDGGRLNEGGSQESPDCGTTHYGTYWYCNVRNGAKVYVAQESSTG